MITTERERLTMTVTKAGFVLWYRGKRGTSPVLQQAVDNLMSRLSTDEAETLAAHIRGLACALTPMRTASECQTGI